MGIRGYPLHDKGRAYSLNAQTQSELIPRGYWEFNRLDLEEREIDMHSAEEIIYTSLRSNQKRMIEQMEFLFSNYEKIQEQLRKTERYTKRNEEEYWVEL